MRTRLNLGCERKSHCILWAPGALGQGGSRSPAAPGVGGAEGG